MLSTFFRRWLLSIAKLWFGQTPAPRRRRRCYPAFEYLEGRLLPSTTNHLITVTSNGDSGSPGSGTLREAINTANLNQQYSYTIDFHLPVGQRTIDLSSNDSQTPTSFGPTALVIFNNITITGNEPGIVLDGMGDHRVFAVTSVGYLYLQDVEVTGGVVMAGSGGNSYDNGGAGGGAGALGGAFYVQKGGSLKIVGSTLTGNMAVGGNGGYVGKNGLHGRGGGGGGGVGGSGASAGSSRGNYGGGGGGGVGGPGSPGVSGNGGNGGPNQYGYTAAQETSGVFGGGGGGGDEEKGIGGNGTNLSSGGFGGGGGGGGGGLRSDGGYGGFAGGGGGSGGTNSDVGDADAGSGGFAGGGGGGDRGFSGPTKGGSGGFAGGSGGNGTENPAAAYYGGGGGGGGGLGGAIFNNGGTVVVVNSTLTGNTARGGAGGKGTYKNNGAPGLGMGGAIFNYNGSLTIKSSTLSGNFTPNGDGSDGVGGSVYSDGGQLYVANSIAGGNSDTHTDIQTIHTSFSGTNDLVHASFNFGGSNIYPQNPVLGPLQNNGGFTETMALLPGSPGIDEGDNSAAHGITTDQRGPGFNRIINNVIDIGAYEYQPPATTTTLTSSANPADLGKPVTFTATVAPTAPGSNALSGAVTFTVNGVPAATVSLDANGVAQYTTSSLNQFANTVTATYNGFTLGDYSFLRSNDSVTEEVDGIILPLSLTVTPNPVELNKDVTITASLSFPSGPAPTGTLEIFLAGDQIAGGQVGSGNGQSFTLSAPVSEFIFKAGTYQVVAEYSGDSDHLKEKVDVPLVVNNGSGSPGTFFAAGSDVGAPALVTLYGEQGEPLMSFDPVPGFTGGIRVATGDVNGDGMPDLIVGTGPGGITLVGVYDGSKLLSNPSNPAAALIAAFQPYGPHFSGGVFVAAGDINGSGSAAIVTGADAGGGPQVNVYSSTQIRAGQFNAPTAFWAYPSTFTGGVRVAVADVSNDGFDDIITTAGPGGGPQVNVYLGVQGPSLFVGLGQALPKPFLAFYAFGSALAHYTGGVTVASMDLNGDGFADLVFGAGAAGDPEVSVVSGAQLSQRVPNLVPLETFNALTPSSFLSGLRVGVGLGFNAAGTFGPLVLVATGPAGSGQIAEYDGQALFAGLGMPPVPFNFLNLTPPGLKGLFLSVT